MKTIIGIPTLGGIGEPEAARFGLTGIKKYGTVSFCD